MPIQRGSFRLRNNFRSSLALGNNDTYSNERPGTLAGMETKIPFYVSGRSCSLSHSPSQDVVLPFIPNVASQIYALPNVTARCLNG